MHAAKLEGGLVRIERVVVRHEQGVATPHLILQCDAPRIAFLRLLSDAAPHEIHILPVVRHLYVQLLDALVQDRKTEYGAAADLSIADRDEVKHFGHEPRRQAIAFQNNKPVVGFRPIPQHFPPRAVQACRRNLARPRDGGCLQSNSR